MPAGDVRSALVVACGEGVDAETVHLRPLARQALELARLLGDRSIGGFEVSLMIGPTAAALRQELGRFLADRAPHDTVVVHLAGRLRHDASGEAHLCGADADPDRSVEEAVPIAFVEEALGRCRSERLVVLLDCPADEHVSSVGGAVADRHSAVPERFRGPGRSVHVAATSTVVEFLRRGQAGRGRTPLPELDPMLLLPPARPATPRRKARAALALAALTTVVLVASAIAVAALGPAGLALAAGALALLAWPLLRLGAVLWRRYPAVEPVPGEGVPFYRL